MIWLAIALGGVGGLVAVCLGYQVASNVRKATHLADSKLKGDQFEFES